MPSTETLINIAEYHHRNHMLVPIDILARLSEAGVEISKYR